MHAQKFQIRYSPVQDRVLIIVTGEDAQERIFGLTRRLVKRLVPGLRNIMGEETFAGLTPTMPFDPPVSAPEDARPGASGDGAQPDPGAPATTAATGDATPGAAGGATPDAEPTAPQPDTHLVTRLRIVEKEKGSHVLQISDAATTLNVPLNRDQIIQFTQGILTVLERSEWALDWNEDPVETEPEAAPQAGAPDAIDITADSPSRYRH